MNVQTKPEQTHPLYEALSAVADYFGIEILQDELSNAGWIQLAHQVEEQCAVPSSLILRLRRSARYVARHHEEWEAARSARAASSKTLLVELITAITPALPAISEPLIQTRHFSAEKDKNDERRFYPDRGYILYDGWKRKARLGAAGVSVALLEGTEKLVTLHHSAVDNLSDDFEYSVVTAKVDAMSVDAVMPWIGRDIEEVVRKAAAAVHKVSRNDDKKAQTAENRKLAERLDAAAELLRGPS